MSLNYRTPGVNVKEYSTNNVSPLIVTSDTVCLVGPAPGLIERTEVVTLNGSSTPVTVTAVNNQNGTTAAFRTANAHNLQTGFQVKVQGFSPDTFNGVYTVVSVPDPNNFVIDCMVTDAVATFGTYYNVSTIPFVYETDPTTAVMTASSIKSVKAVDPTRAKNTASNYNTTSGYVSGSYKFDPVTHTLSRNNPVPTATLSTALDTTTTTVVAKGDPDGFDTYGTILIDSEEITYSSKSFSGEQQTVTVNPVSNPGGSTVAVAVASDITNLTVATTAGSTSANLNDPGTLAINTTYTISSSAIPSANNITFTTGGSVAATSYTVTGVTVGSTGTTVTKSGGSSFTSALVGAKIIVGAQARTVVSITDTNTLVTDTAFSPAITSGTSLTSITYFPITLSSGTGVTTGTNSAATIGTSRVLKGVTTNFTSDMVNGNINVASADYTIANVISGTLAVLATAPGVSITATSTYTIKKPYTLTFSDTTLGNNTTTTTTQILPLATAANIKSALAALTSVGGTSNVAVTGSAQTGYVVTFQGALDGTNVAAMTASITDVTIAAADGTFSFLNCVRAANGTTAATHSVSPTPASITQTTLIADGADVYVNFTYTPGDYFNGLRFTNVNDVERRYGPAYKVVNRVVTSNIGSPLTLAASLAFENGATDVVIQPIFSVSGSTKSAPTNAEITNGSAWRNALESLRAVEGIGTIVPVVGQTKSYNYGSSTAYSLTDQGLLSILQSVQDHIHYQQTYNDQYLVGVFGEDGTDSPSGSSYATPDTLRTHAQILKGRYDGAHAESIVLLSPSQFERSLSSGTGKVQLGGQYAAAAIAGMIASRPVSSTLTRRFISGFDNVLVSRNKADKITDSSYGLFVIEQIGRAIQVRHAITLDDSNSARQELSVVRAKHKVINSLRSTIDTQIIGKIVADNGAAIVVASAVANTLSILVNNGDIVAFGNVQSKIVTLSPTVIEVRFSYRPSFPVNYVDIAFSIDLTGGSASLADTTNNINSGAI